MQRIHYRIGQFLKGVRARLGEEDAHLVTATLHPAAQALFLRMPVDAQAHSVRVLRRLLAEGDVDGDLAVAALLHDVGKVAALEAGAYLGLWLRGPIVLLEALRPGLLRRWASATPSPSLRYALYVQLTHPAIGAAWAQAAGCSTLSCWLIEHHQDQGAHPAEAGGALLTRLQWADGKD